MYSVLDVSIHNYLAPLLDDEVSKASRMENFALRYPSESGHSKNMEPMPDVKMIAVYKSIDIMFPRYQEASAT